MSGAPTVRIAVVGAGSAGAQHAAAVVNNEDAELTVVADSAPSSAEALSARMGGRVWADSIDRLAASGMVDAVVVATPDQFHAEHAIAFLSRGIPVLCEKPMAPTLDDCRAMVQAADESGASLMIGHSVRFTPVFESVRRLVADGVLGDVYYVGTDYQHDYSPMRGTWRFDPALARSLFLGGGCHAVDLARSVLGEVVEVSAMATHLGLPDLPTDDTIIASYATAAGQLSRVFVSGSSKRPYRIGLEVYGTRGSVVATNVDDTVRLYREDQRALGEQWASIRVEDRQDHPFARQMDAFIEAVRAGERMPIDGRAGMATVAASLAAIDAARTGQRVRIPR